MLSRAQTIEWIRQFGSTDLDGAAGVAVNATGVYITGSTFGTLPGQTSAGGLTDAYVRKYDSNGSVMWTRQFGTPSTDSSFSVAVDSTGVYVAGSTTGTLPEQTKAGFSDAFLRKYDFDGDEVWTRQFGAPGFNNTVIAVALDATGIYLAGQTTGTLPGQTRAGSRDSFVRKYDADGNELWTRQFGSDRSDEARGVAVSGAGIYVAGYTFGALPGQSNAGFDDPYLRKYDLNGNELWTRQFGTADNDEAYGVAVDTTGVYIVGGARGVLPGQTNAGAYDAFVRKYDANGNELWTRQFGSATDDSGSGVAVDATGVYVVGYTDGSLPGQTSAGGPDAFVRKYSDNGTEQATLQFGSSSSDGAAGVAVDATGVYIAGGTGGTGGTGGALPGQTSAGGQDAFLAKLIAPLPPGPAVNDGGVVNHASFAPSPAPVAPGSIAAVFGTNLNDGSTTVASSFGPDGKLGTALGGTSVTVNSTPAPLFYSTPSQLGIQIPFEAAGQTTATIVVTVGGKSSVARTFNLDATAPGIFTRNQLGTGIAGVLHEVGITLVTPQNPARPNEVVTFFATGFGALTPPLATGAPATGNQPVAPATVTVEGIPAEVSYSGATTGFVGLYHVIVRIPPSIRTAPDIPVVLTVGGKPSNTVTIPVGP